MKVNVVDKVSDEWQVTAAADCEFIVKTPCKSGFGHNDTIGYIVEPLKAEQKVYIRRKQDLPDNDVGNTYEE